jgi:hypothetical protein
MNHYEQLERQALEMFAQVIAVADAIQRFPYKLHFSNTGINMPTEVAGVRDNPSFDVDKWPSAHQIQATLSQMHQALSDAHQKWGAIPAEQRSRIEQPPVGIFQSVRTPA